MFRIDWDGGGTGAQADTLSAVEKQRAARFRFERDRDAFVARRAGLRRVLAGYLGARPGDVELGADARGKPFLPAALDVAFNLSATRNLALVAVTRGAPIGVDVEAQKPLPDALDMARGLFAAGETAALAALAPPARDDAFLSLWTRKEAYLKGLGVGLAGDLAAAPAAPWSLCGFRPTATAIAALATHGAAARLRFFATEAA